MRVVKIIESIPTAIDAMIRQWVFRVQNRYNSSVVTINGVKKSLVPPSGIVFAAQTTPYSDKFYQSIITEGFKGLDKLIIPRDFVACNQDINPADADPDSVVRQEELRGIIDTFNSSIKVSIGYGSGVLPQAGYANEVNAKQIEGATEGFSSDKSSSNKRSNHGNNDSTTNNNIEAPVQIDFINIVEDNQTFHKQNLVKNRSHYSIKSAGLIKFLQGKNGIYFNPFIIINNRLVKYGTMSINASLLDLCEWTSLYLAGRLQKPVNFVKDDDIRIKFLNQYNLKNAMTVAILLMESNQFNERQLYEQITRLSYLGDFRMYIGGENPNKVQNIVDKQLVHFKKLYEPILSYFIHRNYLIITNNDSHIRTLKKNLNVNNKINLISTLPLQFRTRLYQMYQDKSLKEIAKDKHLAENVVKIVSRTIQISSVRQAILGIFSSGLVKSIKYAVAKQIKFWQGVLNKKSIK
ncbi:hypothetical protein G9P44_002270 [Scheffersomyces stipitis]|nr:hypothetical protein G9P44_002270 [Scheffersomyces stipitis]